MWKLPDATASTAGAGGEGCDGPGRLHNCARGGKRLEHPNGGGQLWSQCHDATDDKVSCTYYRSSSLPSFSSYRSSSLPSLALSVTHFLASPPHPTLLLTTQASLHDHRAMVGQHGQVSVHL